MTTHPRGFEWLDDGPDPQPDLLPGWKTAVFPSFVFHVYTNRDGDIYGNHNVAEYPFVPGFFVITNVMPITYAHHAEIVAGPFPSLAIAATAIKVIG